MEIQGGGSLGPYTHPIIHNIQTSEKIGYDFQSGIQKSRASEGGNQEVLQNIRKVYNSLARVAGKSQAIEELNNFVRNKIQTQSDKFEQASKVQQAKNKDSDYY